MALGIFGGSFDPVHNGHLFVAEAVRDICGLDRVLFVPTRGGHHRSGPLSAPGLRADMIRLAIAANTSFAYDDSDLAPDATGFTADLLPRLTAKFPNQELTFIVGGDSLVRSRWQRLDEIIDALAGFVIAPRGEVTENELDRALAELSPERRAKIRYLDLPLVAESATIIRARLAEGRSVRYLVPEPVFRYIEENELYQ
jgi:nicotinate-nucleotide adenylyltransferase